LGDRSYNQVWLSLETEWKCDKCSTSSTCNFVKFTQILLCVCVLRFSQHCHYTISGYHSNKLSTINVMHEYKLSSRS
jgi:hypothetical protein